MHDYELGIKPDILEMVENRKSTRDMKLLKDIIQWIGLAEMFDFEDYSRLRTVKTRKGYRAYYGKTNMERLVDQGLCEVAGDNCFELTIDGILRVNQIEITEPGFLNY